MSKELILLCQHFIEDHHLEELIEEDSNGDLYLDGQTFFEGVDEADIIEFFTEIYRILSEL